MRLNVFVLMLFNCCLYGQGDLQIHRQFTHKDGLSNNNILSMYLDSRGFLWVGTIEGLNRFDGLHFKTFYHNRDSSNSLPHNKVADIIEFDKGMLLLATSNGLGVYNSQKGRFENDRITYAPLSAGSGTHIGNLHLDKEGIIWVNHGGEIDLLDRELKYLYRLTDLEWARSMKGITPAYEDYQYDRSGRVWIASDTMGLHIVDFENSIVYNQDYNPERLPYLENQFIRSLFLDVPHNALWLAPWGNGLDRYDITSGSMQKETFGQPLMTENSSVNAIVRLGKDKILTSSNGFIFETNLNTLQSKNIASLRRPYPTIQNDLVNAITIVRSVDGVVWIGTSDGLFVLQEQDTSQRVLSIPLTDSTSCNDVVVSPTGVYAVYGNASLIFTNKDRSGFSAYSIPMKANASLSQICEDRKGYLWIGTNDGLLFFNTVSKQFEDLPPDLSRFKDQFVNTLYCDTDGDVWIGTRSPFELYHYSFLNKKLVRIQNEIIDYIADVGANSRISYINEDGQRNIWMRSAVAGGLVRFDKVNNSWTRYPDTAAQLNFIASKGIPALAIDKDDILWLTTNAADGLIRYNYDAGTINQFTREDGILSDNINHIFAEHNNIWVTTEYGVSRFDINTHSVISRNWTDPVFLFEATIDTSANELIVALPGKQLFISTDQYHIPSNVPKPVVDGIYINNKQRFIDPMMSSLTLPYDQRNVTLTFTTGYSSDADKLRFAYFLEGADNEWQYPKDTRTAQYAALAAGRYVFRIKVSDQYGNWSETVDAFSFTIIPPFWRRSWFILLLALSIATSIVFMVRRRINTIRHEASLKQKVAETEMMALRAQMNPHFIFNCINSIDSLIQSDDKDMATHYLNKFARLIRNVLDSSKQNLVTVAKDVETLELYLELERFRHDNKFKVRIDADPMLLQDDFKVPPLIVQPYVENAIHHGLRYRDDDKGQLVISLDRQNGHIRYVIEDNGVGRAFSMTLNKNGKNSYGMQMSHDRIRLFNQEASPSIKVTDIVNEGIPGGTKVEVLLKMI